MTALANELSRIEEATTYAAQSQFQQAKIWRGTNLLIGGPAAVLAAVSGAAGLADASNRTVAAILALLAAGLGAIVTTLNAAQRADAAHTAANSYLAIQVEARQLRLLDLPDLQPTEVRALIADLTARHQQVNASADIPARIAYRLGRRNVTSGRQTYEVDS
ncbi:MAG: SLATT domain-containing protein [Acidimicrobiales bacterium]|nr:SLATT domain-containing protein [Acidimicrobiales bacterium]